MTGRRTRLLTPPREPVRDAPNRACLNTTDADNRTESQRVPLPRVNQHVGGAPSLYLLPPEGETKGPRDMLACLDSHDFHPESRWCVKCGRVRADGVLIATGGAILQGPRKTPEQNLLDLLDRQNGTDHD